MASIVDRSEGWTGSDDEVTEDLHRAVFSYDGITTPDAIRIVARFAECLAEMQVNEARI